MYNVSVKKTGTLKMQLRVNISKDVVNGEFERCYKEAAKKAQIAGFRKGKAPLDIIKTQFKNDVYQQVLQGLVSEYYVNALREKQIIPAEHPKFEIEKFTEGEEFVFTAEFEIKPEVKVNQYKGLKVNKKNSIVKDEDIEKALDYLRENKAEFSPVLEIRPVKEGDFLVVDYTCLVQDELVDKKENVLISTKDTAFPKEFIDQILGLNIAEEKKIKTTLPSKFADSRLAGKEAVFNIKVKEIKKKTVPDVTEEFAVDLGFESMEKLKDVIFRDLKKQKENQSRIAMHGQIVEQLLKKTEFELPPNMLKQQTDSLVQDAMSRLGNLPDGQKNIKAEEETLAQRFKPEAEKQLKLFFILDKIAEDEGIVVTEEEFDNRINILAVQTNQPVSDLKRKFEEKGISPQLKGQMRDEKTMDFLFKEADINTEG